MTIAFGPGITLGAGISVTASITGWTLSSDDFTNYWTGSYITANSNTGFITTNSNTGPGEAVYGPRLDTDNGGSLAKLNELRAYWTANGLTTNSCAYMFNVTWAAGSTLSSGVAIVEFYDYGDTNAGLNLGVVDTSDPIWQTPYTGYYSGPIKTIAGTFNLPATFNIITPLIENNNNWC